MPRPPVFRFYPEFDDFSPTVTPTEEGLRNPLLRKDTEKVEDPGGVRSRGPRKKTELSAIGVVQLRKSVT